MAKHPHRLMLNQKKTWRCTLPNCRYFIHRGLEHTLPGQLSVCWGCGDDFTLDEIALRDDQPKCYDCRAAKDGRPTARFMEDSIEMRIALAKRGVKHLSELDADQINLMKALGTLPKNAEEIQKWLDDTAE